MVFDFNLFVSIVTNVTNLTVSDTSDTDNESYVVTCYSVT